MASHGRCQRWCTAELASAPPVFSLPSSRLKLGLPALQGSPGQANSFLQPRGGMQDQLSGMIGTSVQTYPKVRLGMLELGIECVCR